MNAEPEFREKFIAFVDILGFESKVSEVEDKKNLRLSDLLEFCSSLTQEVHAKSIWENGPKICPKSRHDSRHLDYEVTQISDCAVISAEVSPAGVINLMQHIWSCVYELLTKGIMVRGYVSKGNVYHKGSQIIGSGYVDAYRREKKVGAFGLPQGTASTPFVEIDPVVVSYINDQTDKCVREMFKRMTKEDPNGIAVIFPFQRLSAIAGFNIMNAERCRKNLRVTRDAIGMFLQRLDTQSPDSNSEASQKSFYYKKLLQEQLEECDRIEDTLERLSGPAVRLMYDANLNVILKD